MGHDSWTAIFRIGLKCSTGPEAQVAAVSNILCSWLVIYTNAGTQAFTAGCQDLPY